MATLTANINATQTVIPVSGSVPETGSFFTLDSEAIRFLGTSRGADGRAFLRSYWSVERGVAGTTAATHSNGATLTQYYPDAVGGVGGSGVTVDNGTDPPEAVTTLVAPEVRLDAGTADLSRVFWAGSGSAQSVDGDDSWHDLSIDLAASGFPETIGYSTDDPTQFEALVDGLYGLRARVHVRQAPGSATYRAVEVRRDNSSIGMAPFLGFPFADGLELAPNQEIQIEAFFTVTVGQIIRLRASHDAGAAHEFAVPSFILERISPPAP
jgi:hypothetical protein